MRAGARGRGTRPRALRTMLAPVARTDVLTGPPALFRSACRRAREVSNRASHTFDL